MTRARTLFQRACDADDPVGCDRLGVVYEGGWGVPRDRGRALTLYSRACDLGEQDVLRFRPEASGR